MAMDRLIKIISIFFILLIPIACYGESKEHENLIERIKKIDKSAGEYAQKYCSSRAKKIDGCFVWSLTPQGTQYWRDIEKRLEENDSGYLITASNVYTCDTDSKLVTLAGISTSIDSELAVISGSTSLSFDDLELDFYGKKYIVKDNGNGELKIITKEVKSNNQKEKGEMTMFNFLFSWMGGFVFWGMYVIAGVFIGTIVLRKKFPKIFKLVVYKEPYRCCHGTIIGDHNFEIFMHFIFVLFIIIFWFIPFIIGTIYFVSKYLLFKPLCFVTKTSLKFADQNIPKFKIVKDEEEKEE